MKQDIWCGGVLAVIGAVAVMEGRRHRIGSLTQMEAGYFPVVLGVLLIALGLLIAGMAIRRQSTAPPVPAETFAPPDWRGCSAIIGGVLCFIVFGAYFGLAPATFLCVFISAFGDRTATLRGAFTLAAIMTAIAVGLFAYALQVQFPILDWP